MSEVIKVPFAKLPVNVGNYISGQAYGIKNRVLLYGCEWESLVENNSAAPASLNANTGVITENSTHWRKISGNYNDWLIENGYKKVSAQDVKDTDLNKTQREINGNILEEIGANDIAGSIKGRIKEVENTIGNGGSVDTRIAQAKAEAVQATTTESERAQAAEALLQAQYQALTQDDKIIGPLPDSGVANKIYRVPGENSYADYMWDGSWHLMATYDNAIDQEPEKGSPNIVSSGGVHAFVEGRTPIRLHKCNLRNGSVGSRDNANLVCTDICPATIFRRFELHTNRPNTEGYHYEYQYAGAKAAEGFTGNRSGDVERTGDQNETRTTDNHSSSKNLPATLGMCFGITEVSDSDNTTTNPLRIGDFTGYEVWITCSDIIKSADNPISISGAVSSLFRRDGLMLPRMISDGGVGSAQNPNKVRTAAIDIRNLSKIKAYTDRPAPDGYKYCWGVLFTSNVEAIGQLFSDNSGSGSYTKLSGGFLERDLAVEAVVPTGAVTASIELCLKRISDGEVLTLRRDDFSEYVIAVEDVGSAESAEEVVNESLGIRTYRPIIHNGNNNNENNANAVCSMSLMEARQGDVFEVIFHKEPAAGNHFSYVFYESNSTEAFHGLSRNGRLLKETASQSNKYTISDPGCVAINVAVYEEDSEGVRTPLRVANIDSDAIEGKVFPKGGVLQRLQELENKTDGIASDAWTRNKDKAKDLLAACRFNNNSSHLKDFQLLMVTDSHYADDTVRNAAVIANGFDTIDAVIHCGDMGDTMTHEDGKGSYKRAAAVCEKPFYHVIGNHEAGTYNIVGISPSHQRIFDVLIQPMIDNGHLLPGEYVSGECYYYHDFTERQVRLIVLNMYDSDLVFDETYWQAVPYDEEAAQFSYNRDYHVGDVVRMPYRYTEYCFRCIRDCHTGTRYASLNGEEPRYRCAVKNDTILAGQAQWFLNTLASTPANYAVVIAMHPPFSWNVNNVPERKFCKTDSVWTIDRRVMVTDFVPDAVHAFMEGVQYTAKVIFDGDASYRNVLNDGNVSYAYQVTKDFSQKNQGVTFMCYIGGHYHNDLILRHQIYTDQYQVLAVCSNTAPGHQSNNDIRRAEADGPNYDSLTAISFNPDARSISLVKIGVDVTDNMEHRDIERITLNNE